jgi:hypothetical protein
LRRFALISIALVGYWALSHSAQIENKSSIRYSANGDTAYVGNFAMVKSKDHELSAVAGAFIGTAPRNAIASVNWGPEVRLTFSNDSQFVNSFPVGAVCNDTLLLYFAFGLPWPIDSPYLMQS